MLGPASELFFWSTIMRDHADFIYNALSPKEKEFIDSAMYYKNEWIKINKEIEPFVNTQISENVKEIVNRGVVLLKNFIDYKKIILTKLLKCDISINFTPSFISHMLNEANEFYRNLYLAVENKQLKPIDEVIVLHKIWLRDASGHANGISCQLDPNEYILVMEAKDFADKFNKLFIKAYELGQMLERTQVESPSILYFNNEVEMILTDFINFLDKVKLLRLECKALGYLEPMVPDHMIREEKYYLTKVKNAIL